MIPVLSKKSIFPDTANAMETRLIVHFLSQVIICLYHANDILLIARNPIRDGDTGIFINKVTGLLYIRRLRQTDPWRLEPLTYYGQTFYIDSNNASEMSHWIIFGHVISKTRG